MRCRRGQARDPRFLFPTGHNKISSGPCSNRHKTEDHTLLQRGRRAFLGALSVGGAALTLGRLARAAEDESAKTHPRRIRFVHVDVFASKPFCGNPLFVFTDARGLSDAQMQAVARETHLYETTFVIPRDRATEREHGVSVRIFTPNGEIPFAGHPTLGTAAVLRAPRSVRLRSTSSIEEITLDLKVGKVPVSFRTDQSGATFGEMHQVPPKFGSVLDRDAIARLHNLTSSDISDEGPIQIVSTGLPFAIVPLKYLSALQSLQIDRERMAVFLATQETKFGFYYVTRETGDPDVALRTRSLHVDAEDPATGSAAGCTVAWLVRYGIAAPEQTLHIRQGVEIQRPSELFVRASKEGDEIVNVRVGGYCVQTMEGEASL
jgi:trans-2,3-dihydro-3-hydroxyanthranilate isomerase